MGPATVKHVDLPRNICIRIYTYTYVYRRPFAFELSSDIKAGAMGLRRLVARNYLPAARSTDNYVPIKFNDCPLFRFASVT